MSRTLGSTPTIRLRTLFDEVFGQITFAAKRGWLEREGILGLGVECRVLHKGVDEDPHVIFDLERFDGCGLVFLFDLVHAE